MIKRWAMAVALLLPILGWAVGGCKPPPSQVSPTTQQARQPGEPVSYRTPYFHYAADGRTKVYYASEDDLKLALSRPHP